MSAPVSVEGVRVDVWLWAARFFKTRSLAKEAVTLSRVKIAGQSCKPSRLVRVGDVLAIERGGEVWEVVVQALSETRGPATVAQGLYAERETSRIQREAQRAMRAAERAGYQPPAHRPDKRARRLIQALGDLDAL